MSSQNERGDVMEGYEAFEPGLCMADAPQACVCGRCNLRSDLTNAGVASIEVQRDRALQQLRGAVDALREIDARTDTPGAWDRAYFEVKAIARDALARLGGR